MNKKSLYLTALTSILFSAVISCLVSYIIKKDEKKTAFVKLIEVYENFELKKQFTQKLQQTERAKKSVLDSLEFNLKALQMRLENTNDKKLLTEFQLYKDDYLYKKQQFDEDNTELSNSYNKQIWNQLNQYVSDYGEENDYSYIFGTDGSGSIMYGKEDVDITPQIIEYVNKKFQGK